jgi:hypothetical protein
MCHQPDQSVGHLQYCASRLAKLTSLELEGYCAKLRGGNANNATSPPRLSMTECTSSRPSKRLKETPIDSQDDTQRTARSMEVLPVVVLAAVLEFANHEDLHALLGTSTQLYHAVHAGGS